MPPSNDPGTTRATRALQLYELLLYTGKKLYLADLCKKYGWHTTTVQRTMESIDRAVGGLDSGKDARGRVWYRLCVSGERPRPAVQPEAVRLLLACRDMVAHLLPDATRAELDDTIARTTVLLPDMGQRDLAFVTTSRGTPRGAIDYSGFREVIDVLSDAIASRHLVRIRYKVPDRSDPRTHLVAPITLMAHRDTLYLRCRQAWPDGELKPDYDVTLMAVHRMLDVERTEATFEWPEEDLPTRLGVMNMEPVRARVEFEGWSANYVRERTWSSDQVLEELEDGRVVLEFTASSLPEAVTWVLGFGREAKALSPKELRERVLSELARTVSRYR